MQRSEGRSGASNTPTLAENQNSDSHHESQMEVQYCNIRMNMLPCEKKNTWILSLLLNFLKPNLFQANIQPVLAPHFVDNRLLFHPNCGSHAAVINSGLSAHRPNATDDFNFGVVLTNRPLKPNEVFEVRLDKMVTKWTGSIEIGVTTHSPNSLEFPSTMTNVRFRSILKKLNIKL